jgi:hypothetical protein
LELGLRMSMIMRGVTVKARKTVKKRKPAIDVPKMFLVLARQQAEIIEEMRLTTPSHAWHNMREIRGRAIQLVAELEEIVDD